MQGTRWIEYPIYMRRSSAASECVILKRRTQVGTTALDVEPNDNDKTEEGGRNEGNDQIWSELETFLHVSGAS